MPTISCRVHRVVTAWLLLAVLAASPAAAQDLVIRFLNVGQGDAALITGPEGKQALIDGGSFNGLTDFYLDSLHVDTLDLVVASHNHADHIGGLQDVAQHTVVRYYMDNGLPTTTQSYRHLCALLDGHQVTYLAATPRNIALGSVTLRILPRPPGEQDQNNGSVGVLLSYGSFTALFTGDAEHRERAYWEAHAALPQVTVLKVAHHGASNGTDAQWLDATRPSVAVISVGAHNTYGHPSKKTLKLLKQAGVRVYRTDVNGTIEVTVRPDGVFTVAPTVP